MRQVLHHQYVDILQRKIFPAEIVIEQQKIVSVTPTQKMCSGYVLPGFIDAHIHIESSLLIPSSFAQIAVKHGTVATVSDPHEIANVCGLEGIEFMLNNAEKVPFNFFFGAPSCVPATRFETAGDTIDAEQVGALLQRKDIYYLSEMMNYPGVLHRDAEVMKKIAFAKQTGKPIDGHAPGLRSESAKQYIEAGISTDHECVTYAEAEEKIKLGMFILIREGSAAKNFDALIDLLSVYPGKIMFCCDDKHPDELILHHINNHVKRAVAKGINVFDVLYAACILPVLHYHLPVGLLQVGDDADFIVVDDLKSFVIRQTCIKGNWVFQEGKVHIPFLEENPINQFSCDKIQVADLAIHLETIPEKIRVIEAIEGQLITKTGWYKPTIVANQLLSNVEHDILKIVVVNRYQKAPIAKAFIKNFNLTHGAIASTIAHDSHNIICVGTNDDDMCTAINALVDCFGGIVVADGNETHVLPLQVGGLMSNEQPEKVTDAYIAIDAHAKTCGCTLHAPFMTLSFMALLVIPQLKLSDKGLFDGEKFTFVDLF
jgi:adenine deaminase